MAISSSAQVPHQAANSKSELEFAGKVALITGGTRGIGAATARRVAKLGAKVLIQDAASPKVGCWSTKSNGAANVQHS